MASPSAYAAYKAQSEPAYASVESTTSIIDGPDLDEQAQLQLNDLRETDLNLKRRIRILRLISRLANLILSVAVFVPITMTVHKFLTTRDIYRDVVLVDGTTAYRTAWAAEPKAWPTYMYFSVACTSLFLDVGILISYLRSVKMANEMGHVGSAFSWVVFAGNLVVWAVAVGIYRYEKDEGERPRDLWGWTCSGAAARIQNVFSQEVEFEKFCGVQSASWVAGMIQVAAALLSLIVYFWAVRRRQMKKSIGRLSGKLTDDP